MFYSHFYLKRTGRFGLIWLAATQSKVLSKREICAISIIGTCNDIIKHIPAQRGGGARHSNRFSLYLCCQLLYGSAKVLQKQWDYLFVDVTSCYKRCNPEIPTADIELAVPRLRHGFTLESRVPTDKMDPNFDPFFGMPKDITPDIESVLNALETSHKEQDQLTFDEFPSIVKPEIGSPHSVSDPRDIQIADLDMSQLSIELPGEQELPIMDSTMLEELLSPVALPPGGETFPDDWGQAPALTAEGPMRQDLNVDQPLEVVDIHQGNTTLRDGNMFAQLSPLEETPLSKPGSEMPAPPRKPKPAAGRPRKTKPHAGTDGRQGQSDGHRESVPQDEEMLFTDNVAVTDQPVTGTEEQPRGHGHDWQQRNPPLVQLSPLLQEQSPLRKKRPHKLIIDTSLMISKPEMREQMENTEDIISPMILNKPCVERRYIYKDPSHDFLLQNKDLNRLFTRNCKFGLRMDDSGSERDSIFSPGLLDVLNERKRTRRHESDETLPLKLPRLSEELPSVEHERGASSRYSKSFEGDRNLSHSLIAQSGDESIASSKRQQESYQEKDVSGELSANLQDISHESAKLAVWPEEPELNISVNTVPVMARINEEYLQVTDQNGDGFMQDQMTMPLMTENNNGINGQNGQAMSLDDGVSESGVLTLIKHQLRNLDDVTTFRSICPPSQYSKNAAASLFSDLCLQVSMMRVSVRQEEAYGEIYIWLSQS